MVFEVTKFLPGGEGLGEGPEEFSEQRLHRLTPELVRVDLTPLANLPITSIEIVSPGEDGPKNFPQAMEALKLDPLQRRAVRARINARGVGVDNLHPGDTISFEVRDWVLLVEQESKGRVYKYAVPLKDEPFSFPQEKMREGFEIVSRKQDIVIKTRRAWEGLQEAADSGILYRVLQAVGLNPRDRAVRRSVWEEMQGKSSEIIGELQKHRQLKDIDEAFLNASYVGSAKQHRAMIEYLRWKQGEEMVRGKLPEVSPEVKAIAERLQGNLLAEDLMIRGQDPKFEKAKRGLERAVDQLARDVQEGKIPEAEAMKKAERMGLPAEPENVSLSDYKLSTYAENFAKASGLYGIVTVAARESVEGSFILKTAKGSYNIFDTGRGRYELRNTEDDSFLFGFGEGISRKMVKIDEIRRAIQIYESERKDGRKAKSPIDTLDWL